MPLSSDNIPLFSLPMGNLETEESPEELLAMLPHQEVYREGMRCFTAHRRLEWLAVRVLLYTLSGEEKEIAYHPSGKPYLADASRPLQYFCIRKVMWLLFWDCRVGKWALTLSSMVNG